MKQITKVYEGTGGEHDILTCAAVPGGYQNGSVVGKAGSWLGLSVLVNTCDVDIR